MHIGNITAHVFVFFLLALTVAVAVIFHVEAIANARVITALEITFIVLFLLTKIFQDLQQVYVIFRYFHNRIYPEEFALSNTLHW